jgi:D-aminopeptidase
MSRARLRDLGITIGEHPIGAHNAITDVPGVTVGHTTLIHDEPRIARTGVTVVMPRSGNVQDDNVLPSCRLSTHDNSYWRKVA